MVECFIALVEAGRWAARDPRSVAVQAIISTGTCTHKIVLSAWLNVRFTPVATTGTDIPVRQLRASATDRIRRHGGLMPRLIVLCGRELAAMSVPAAGAYFFSPMVT
jgi:hypothetical protein